MRVEAKMRIKDKPHDIHYDLEEGDQKNVPEDVGQNWVANGWAKNLETGEDNPPSANPVTLDIEGSAHTSTSTEV